MTQERPAETHPREMISINKALAKDGVGSSAMFMKQPIQIALKDVGKGSSLLLFIIAINYSYYFY